MPGKKCIPLFFTVQIMKVIFCTYDNPTFHGGPNVWLKRLLPLLIIHGIDIEIIFFVDGPIDDCPTYLYFKNNHFRTYTYSHRETAEKKIKWILDIVASSRPDVFVPNMLVHAFYASRWIKEAGIPTVGLIHSDDAFHEGIIEEFVLGKAA